MTYSPTEENYIKAIFHLSAGGEGNISTNDISHKVNATAASVTDMLKKLKAKKLIVYEKYRGVSLTNDGEIIAKSIIRKHRLWEVFLVEKLGYSWEKIHDLAEQLEHVRSEELIERLDQFLNYPKFDPHGDPIPDASGKISSVKQMVLSGMTAGDKGKVVGVKDSSAKLLEYLTTLQIQLGTEISVLDVVEFDSSMILQLNKKQKITISKITAQNIFIG